MSSLLTTSPSTLTSSIATSTTSLFSSDASEPTAQGTPTVHHSRAKDNPVIAFIIGLAIVLLASVLNAGGLNLTKLDHVRTSAVPKAARRKDWLRPLWLLGMILYILSQLIGSTLALEYLRAEYVAPLGSTSLIFNFLFASMLVGTPVTSTDIYGTIIVIVGVIGIVLFGSMNSGLENGMDASLLSHLWSRAGWIVYFLTMTLTLTLVYMGALQLESILVARGEIDVSPRPGTRRNGGWGFGRGNVNAGVGGIRIANERSWGETLLSWYAGIVSVYMGTMRWLRDQLEAWSAPKDDKTIAWTLGIGWACCGGGLAGGCLVFAKASVGLISGKISHESTGNQFLHFSSIATFIFLGITAILQIICLNRGLRIYDSTLVVPVFYGVYTGTGWLNSLVFNDEIGRYKGWALFLVFVSVLVLVAGVVLLTHKKPEKIVQPQSQAQGQGRTAHALGVISSVRTKKGGKKAGAVEEGDVPEDEETLRPRDLEEGETIWELGEVSDDENDVVGNEGEDGQIRDAEANTRRPEEGSGSKSGKNNGSGSRDKDEHLSKVGLAGSVHGEEGRGLMQNGDEADDEW